MADGTLAIAMVSLFVAVFIAIEALYIWWNSTKGPEAVRLTKRLRMISAGGYAGSAEVSVLKRRLSQNTPIVERILMLVPRARYLDRFVVQSGIDWSVSYYLGISAGLYAFGFLGTLMVRQPLGFALLVACGFSIAPSLYLLIRRQQRLKKFESLLPEALDLIGRALRAGHSLPSALQMAGAELPAPIGEEFQQTFDEINFGISAQDALRNLAARVPSTDLGFFVISVMIQRETGGNLSEVLANISAIIRERLKLFGKVRALSAEGRFSGLVLTLLPFAVGALLYSIDPEYTSLLWRDPTGKQFSYAGLFFMFVGVLWMQKIIRIRV